MRDSPNQRPTLRSASTPLDDPAEFAARYRQAYPQLTVIAAAIIGDRSVAEDIVQEAAVIAVEKLGQLAPDASFAGWLAAIVRHCALNYRRKVRRRRTFPADPARMRDMQAPDGAPDAAVHVAAVAAGAVPREAFDDQVHAALADLSDDARCCLMLRIVVEMPYVEIAKLLEIPEGTAMSHVHRAKSILRQRLASRTTQSVAPHPS